MSLFRVLYDNAYQEKMRVTHFGAYSGSPENEGWSLQVSGMFVIHEGVCCLAYCLCATPVQHHLAGVLDCMSSTYAFPVWRGGVRVRITELKDVVGTLNLTLRGLFICHARTVRALCEYLA